MLKDAMRELVENGRMKDSRSAWREKEEPGVGEEPSRAGPRTSLISVCAALPVPRPTDTTSAEPAGARKLFSRM